MTHKKRSDRMDTGKKTLLTAIRKTVLIAAGIVGCCGMAAEILSPASHGGCASLLLASWNTEASRWVGNPNPFPRNDRSVWQFDLSQHLRRGRIERAVLTAPFAVTGYFDTHELELEVFQSRHAPVAAIDVISSDVSPCAVFPVGAEAETFTIVQDVTDEVNAALRRGDGSVTFRLRDRTIEKLGNRRSRKECVTLSVEQIKLELSW